MNSVDFLKNRAWQLATDPDPEQRDAVGATELIERAIKLSSESGENLMVLAAAQAAAGDFTTAAGTAKRARPLAKKEKDSATAGALKGHLAGYKKGHLVVG